MYVCMYVYVCIYYISYISASQYSKKQLKEKYGATVIQTRGLHTFQPVDRINYSTAGGWPSIHSMSK